MKAKAEQKPEQLSMKVADFDRIMGAALQVPAAPRSTTRRRKGKGGRRARAGASG